MRLRGRGWDFVATGDLAARFAAAGDLPGAAALGFDVVLRAGFAPDLAADFTADVTAGLRERPADPVFDGAMLRNPILG